MTSALADLRALGAAGLKEWRLLRRYPSMFIGFLFWPIALPLSYVLQAQGFGGSSAAARDAFAQRAGTADVAGFLFLGWAAYMWISMILWGPGTALRTDQIRGTLEAVFMTPASRLVIIFGPVVSQVVWAVWMFAIVGGVLVVFFGAPIGPLEALRALAVILVAVPALYGLGALFAAVVLRFGEVQAMVQGVRGVFTVLLRHELPDHHAAGVGACRRARAAADLPDRRPAPRPAHRGRPRRARPRPRDPVRHRRAALRRGGRRLPSHRAPRSARRLAGAVLMHDVAVAHGPSRRDDLAAEWRAALALARKELRIARRYPLNLVNEVLQPLYQFLLPSLLLGATFLVGGRAIGLESSTGTSDLAGYLFLGMIVGGLTATGVLGDRVQLQARDGRGHARAGLADADAPRDDGHRPRHRRARGRRGDERGPAWRSAG